MSKIDDILRQASDNNEYFGNDGWYELHTATLKQALYKDMVELAEECPRYGNGGEYLGQEQAVLIDKLKEYFGVKE